MSRTNCFLPSRGFCLNFRVRMVKSLIASACWEGDALCLQRQGGGAYPQNQNGLSQ